MLQDPISAPVRPAVTVTVGAFKPQDAQGIVALFQGVYGDSYPVRLFYDPAALTNANAAGRYYSIVARSADGQVIGVQHLFRSAPHPHLYEAGAGLVRKDYRGSGVNAEMMRHMFDRFVPGMPNIEATFGEAVCYHTHMQKRMIACRHVETAIEVALMPAETYGNEKSTTSRVATVNGFRTFRPRPHQVHLPTVYEAVLRQIYGRLDDRRDLQRAAGALPAAVPSQLKMDLFSFAQVARIAAERCGGDLGEHLAALEAEALKSKTVVFQVWLNLTDPCVGAAVQLLRGRGYFFGGVLPRWFDGDGLLMQKLLCPPNFEDIQLETEDSRQLLAFIRQDWEEAQQIQG